MNERLELTENTDDLSKLVMNLTREIEILKVMSVLLKSKIATLKARPVNTKSISISSYINVFVLTAKNIVLSKPICLTKLKPMRKSFLNKKPLLMSKKTNYRRQSSRHQKENVLPVIKHCRHNCHA